MMNNKVQNDFFCVLHRALLGKRDAAIVLSEKEWLALYKMSRRQGVCSLIFNALDDNSSIPHKLRMRWALSSEMIKNRHELQIRVLNGFSSFLHSYGIDVLLLKGLGLSAVYPFPEQRECGDIDIYSFDDYDKINELMLERSIAIEHEDEKHSSFHLDNVPIENHRLFLYTKYNASDRVVQPYIKKILTEEQCPKCPYGENVSMLPPDANVLFLASHMTNHFAWSGIVIRHLCDWVLFLKENHREINWDLVNHVWSRSGQMPILCVLTAIAVDKLGMPANWFPALKITKVRNADISKSLYDILYPIPSSASTKNLFLKFVYKTKVYRRRKWKQNMVHHIKSYANYFDVLLNRKEEKCAL